MPLLIPALLSMPFLSAFAEEKTGDVSGTLIQLGSVCLYLVFFYGIKTLVTKTKNPHN
ncbi:MAG: hypothetical protein ACFCU4_05815 [Puniceicoccaceae bacterium]